MSRYRVKPDSMRRSGTSHINATNTYTPRAIQGLRNASGIAARYRSGDTFPLRSRPKAVRSLESGPSSAMIAV